MTEKICITGCHGAGKTTLSNKLAEHYTSIGNSVHVVNEVARSCPYPLGTVQAQRFIWYEQWNRELEAAKSSADILIYDRSVMCNLVYLRDILNQSPSGHGEESFKFFYAVAKLHMLKYDFVLRLPLNESYITNDIGDTLRPKDLGYARRIDKLFDGMIDPFVNATVEDLPL